MMGKRVLFILVLLSITLSWTCSSKAEPLQKKTFHEKLKDAGVRFARASDAKVIISAFQRDFQPVGKPLSETQINFIEKTFDPESPENSMKYIWKNLTDDQRKIQVDKMAQQMEQLGYPLSKRQIKRLMNFGPNSKYNLEDIYTAEQQDAIISQMLGSQKSLN